MKKILIVLTVITPALVALAVPHYFVAEAQQPAVAPAPQSSMQAVIQTLQQQRNRALSEAEDAQVTVASLQAQIALERDWWQRWWAGMYPAAKK